MAQECSDERAHEILGEVWDEVLGSSDADISEEQFRRFLRGLFSGARAAAEEMRSDG